MNTLRKLIILNYTPDSFSDGGNVFSSEALSARIRDLTSKGFTRFDIGAESTAPMNTMVSATEELERWQKIILTLSRVKNLQIEELSIDTYRQETIEFVVPELKSLFPSLNIIWNDISGKWEKSSIELVKELGIDWVIGHNLAPERESSSFHIKYVDESDDFYDRFREHFLSVDKVLRGSGIEDRVILDPCFGFSKSLEQNNKLLWRLPEFFNKLGQKRIMLGISRKSFLKTRVESSDLSGLESWGNFFHLHWLQALQSKELWIRTHDEKEIERVGRFYSERAENQPR